MVMRAEHHVEFLQGLANRHKTPDKRRAVEQAKPHAQAPLEGDDSAEPPRLQRMLREHELLEILPFGRSSLYALIRDGAFPRPYSILKGTHFWFERDIIAWQEAIAEQEPTPSRRGGRRRKESA
jgi:prophage regulatory protein